MIKMLIILFAISLVIFVLYKFYKNQDNSNNISKEKEKEKPLKKTSKLEESINSLVYTNYNLRKRSNDKEVIDRVENIIDNLIEVLKDVNNENNYSENTPLMNRMATKYIPDYLNTYLSLTDKDSKKESFLKGLDSLEQTLFKAKNAIENQEIDEYSKQMGFIKAFFDDDFNGGKE